MKAKVGTYHFGRHRQLWGIWVYTNVSETGSCSKFIKDEVTFEAALKEVYKLNGWGEPKKVVYQY